MAAGGQVWWAEEWNALWADGCLASSQRLPFQVVADTSPTTARYSALSSAVFHPLHRCEQPPSRLVVLLICSSVAAVCVPQRGTMLFDGLQVLQTENSTETPAAAVAHSAVRRPSRASPRPEWLIPHYWGEGSAPTPLIDACSAGPRPSSVCMHGALACRSVPPNALGTNRPSTPFHEADAGGLNRRTRTPKPAARQNRPSAADLAAVHADPASRANNSPQLECPLLTRSDQTRQP